MTSDYQVALAGLLRCSEPPVSTTLAGYVRDLGAERAWAHLAERRAPAAVLAATAARLGSWSPAELRDRARTDLRAAAAVGARIVGPEDDGWPEESFVPLEWVRPADGCPAARPLALYVRGDFLPAEPREAVSIVGSRAATPYGSRVATELAAQAAEAGRAVVSGAAFGIDAAAHRGALTVVRGGPGGVTSAVLACGIDRYYPAAHSALLDAVAVRGSVISEYPPATTPARHRFLVRNRLIAALGEATVVVEAGRRSGSLNTATTAANLGRVVAAVPGAVTSALSVGCHDLIRDGRASLVTGWSDTASLLGPMEFDAPPHRQGTRPTDALDLIASRVHEALPASGTIDTGSICIEADLPVSDVIAALAVLEMEGLAIRDGAVWRRVALDLDTGPRAPSTV